MAKRKAPPRTIDSDALGKMGERLFEAWCAAAGLLINAATWDRGGWDVLVDWPLDKSGHLPLDGREAPISCHVQVKCVWEGNTQIDVRLSSIEKLAKDMKPSFVSVIEVDANGTPVSLYVVELADKFLASVLRKLRETHALGKSSNKVDFSFSATMYGTVLAPHGHAFRKHVESIVQPSLWEYATAKRRQLQTLGYESGSLIFKGQVSGTRAELLEGFLGLRSLPADSVEALDNRFNIPIPRNDLPSGPARLEIRPKPFDKCDIIVARASGPPAVFKGKMYGLPRFMISNPDEGIVLIRTELFRLLLELSRGSQTQSVRLTTERETLKQIRQSATRWRDYFELIARLSDGPLPIEIVPHKMKSRLRAIFSSDLERQPALWNFERVARILQRILKDVGAPDVPIALNELRRTGSALEIVDAVMDRPQDLDSLTFETLLPDIAPPLESVPLLHFNIMRFDRFALICTSQLEVHPSPAEESVVWQASSPRFISLRRLRNVDSEFNSYVQEMARSTGIENWIVFDPAKDGDGLDG